MCIRDSHSTYPAVIDKLKTLESMYAEQSFETVSISGETYYFIPKHLLPYKNMEQTKEQLQKEDVYKRQHKNSEQNKIKNNRPIYIRRVKLTSTKE